VANRLRKQLGWVILADPDSLKEPIRTVVEFLNTFLLFDIIVFLRSLSALRRNQKVLREILDAIGSLDAAISAASYWKSLPIVTRPTIVDAREFSATGIYHPLIPNAVSNSVSLSGRSALVAGPNMAGKTAFIKTVGINLILGRSLNICLASSAILPRATVQSSIKREDAIQEGKSYFFVEIDLILGFVEKSANEDLCLFLIDEPFRGTNTIERVAISSAVLRHLSKRQIVMASTHDVELQALLGDSFDMLNFSDHVTDGAYGFDYKIHAGPAASRNAIRLLELRGYPLSVTSEAELLAARLSNARGMAK
jgi:DNA mismatch repair ATPase MutS